MPFAVSRWRVALSHIGTEFTVWYRVPPLPPLAAKSRKQTIYFATMC
jgi:hypothetical protein